MRKVFFDWLREHRPDLLPRYEELYRRGAYLPEAQRREIERAAGAPWPAAATSSAGSTACIERRRSLEREERERRRRGGRRDGGACRDAQERVVLRRRRSAQRAFAAMKRLQTA